METIGLILLVVALAFVAFVVIKSIALIPQGEAAVIERLGSYTRTVSGGLTLLVPFIDRVRTRIDTRERALRRLRQRGYDGASEQSVADEAIRISERDARDARQTIPAPDAVTIDTTALTQPEQVEQIVTLSRQRA